MFAQGPHAPHARYRQTQNETASAPRILVLLLQKARRELALADAHLAATPARVRAAAPHTQRVLDIVAELNDSLDAHKAPELADKLSSLYAFVMARLLAAAKGDRKALQEAAKVFTPVAEAFERAVAEAP